MDTLSKMIPEIGVSANAAEVPWDNAVVWSQMPRGADRLYEWLEARHIRYVSWSNGIVSVLPHPDSIVSSHCQFILLPQAFVWIGKAVPVA